MKRTSEEFRIAVVGCGQIGWIHLSHILRQKVGKVVAICDLDSALAKKTAGAFDIPRSYGDFQELLSRERPDVVHVVTPPFAHASPSIQAMRAGSHVLVEKPMAVTLEDADLMIAVARETGRSLCVDHNRLFSPGVLRGTRYLDSGELGSLMSVDFFQGYGLAPGARLSDIQNQWFTKLPGGLIQDLAPHGLSLLLEFVGAPRDVKVAVKSSEFVPVSPVDEVRLIMEGERILGTYTISLCTRPFMNYVTLYGSKMTVRVNLDNFTTVVRRDRVANALLRRCIGGIDEGAQLAVQTFLNTVRFAIGKLPRCPDIAEVIRRFYGSLRERVPPPVTMEQGREVVRLIAEITRAIAPQPCRRRREVTQPARILLTGGTGFVGRALVRRLLAQGIQPRVFARPSKASHELEALGIDVVLGDLTDQAAVRDAVQGVDIVYHCAGRIGAVGTREQFMQSNVEGTQNLLEASRRAGVQRFVHLSSLGVYGPPKNGHAIGELTPYDSEPERRGYYSYSKILAERIVLEFVGENGLNVTIFRPGIIFGKGRALPTAPLAFSFGKNFTVIGSGHYLLPLTYVENLVDALLLAGQCRESVNRQFNIVDREDLTSSEYHRTRGRIDGTRAVFVTAVPFRLAAPGIELLGARLHSDKLAGFSSHSLERVLKSIRYDTGAVRGQLGWKPRVPLEDALRASIS